MQDFMYVLQEDESFEIDTADGIHMDTYTFYLIDTTQAQPVRYIVGSDLEAYDLCEAKGLIPYKTEFHNVSVIAEIYAPDERTNLWTDYFGTCVLKGVGMFIYAQERNSNV